MLDLAEREIRMGNAALVQILITKFEAELLLAVLPECRERRMLEYKIAACDTAIKYLRGISTPESNRLCVPASSPSQMAYAR